MVQKFAPFLFSFLPFGKPMLIISTCATYPAPPQNLLPLQQQLIQAGLPTEFEPWQQTLQADFILPLCAWDYAAFHQQFQQWIKQHADKFINPADLMLWNSNKRYLLDLQQWGVRVIPTAIADANPQAVQQALADKDWAEIVIKPAVGQSGNHVHKLKAGEPLPDLSQYGEQVILQPFIREVASNGETSLIFFNGQFSHTIRRQPAANEWRANSQYKVEISAVKVTQNIIDSAQQVLQKLPAMPVYARVDGTIIEGQFLLNELELIEPALYLDRVEQAYQRFSQALLTRIGQ